MKQDVQLYIEGQRIDLFDDESIQVTSSIQDVKDIAKVFSDYSQSFSVKASRNNNIVFKHYHDGSIINGYDARFRSDAIIEINHSKFRSGTIRLNNVKMKNNRAYAYDLTFFGSTVTLSRILGEKLISSLDTYLSNYDHDYSYTNIKTGFTSGLTLNSQANAVIYPFITSKYRMVYDSSVPTMPENTRNVYDNTLSKESAGLHSTDLKPAIKLIHIIEAIENQYSEITFSRDFFGTTDFTELYMWLHRQKGNISSDELRKVQISTLEIDSWFGVTSTSNSFTIINVGAGYCAADAYGTSITLNVSDSSAVFSLSVEQNGEVIFNESGLNGETLYAFSIGALDDGEYKVFISTKDSFTVSGSIDFSYIADPECTNAGDANTLSITSFNSLSGFTMRIVDQMPEIKIIDFLTGLFKMFNLTAYVNNSGVIVVDTLDNFYSGVNTDAGTYQSFDITDHVDFTTSNVKRIDVYSQINLKYKDPNTFLAKAFNERENKQFGASYFEVIIQNKYIDGQIYKIELPFEKLMYERLTNGANDDLTNIGYGWFVNRDEKEVSGAPVIFYRVPETATPNALYLKNLTDTAYDSISTYNRASNVKEDRTQTLNFDAETDEFNGDFNENSLFANFYSNYINSVFNESNRLLSVQAVLPLNVLVNYKLGDRFIIRDKSYKINSITSNLLNNKSNLELLEDL